MYCAPQFLSSSAFHDSASPGCSLLSLFSTSKLNWLDPAAVVETWPDTGHFPHLAQPGRFAELLAEAGLPAAGLAVGCWAGPNSAPALICGNTVVIKPASLTPLSVIMLTEAFAYHERDLRTKPELYGDVTRPDRIVLEAKRSGGKSGVAPARRP